MTANWVGYACGYAPYGAAQWRTPLGIQIPWGIILFIGLATFMPDSPRQLVRDNKIEAARIVCTKIRSDLHSHEVQEEFSLMQAQIAYEKERQLPSFWEMIKLYRRRAFVYVDRHQIVWNPSTR